MCCYTSQKKIKRCASCLCFTSTILLLLSLVTVVLSLLVSQQQELMHLVPMTQDDKGNDLFMLNDISIAVTLLTCGIVFLMSLWGCSMKCMKTKCCLLPFAFLLLVLHLVFLSVGGLAVV